MCLSNKFDFRSNGRRTRRWNEKRRKRKERRIKRVGMRSTEKSADGKSADPE
jgi:hypothetical protein